MSEQKTWYVYKHTNKNSIQEASNWCKVHNSGISKCLKGIQKTAGKHPVTKQPLKWQYYNG